MNRKLYESKDGVIIRKKTTGDFSPHFFSFFFSRRVPFSHAFFPSIDAEIFGGKAQPKPTRGGRGTGKLGGGGDRKGKKNEGNGIKGKKSEKKAIVFL